MGKVFCHDKSRAPATSEDPSDTDTPHGIGMFASDHQMPVPDDPPPKSGKPLSHAKPGFAGTPFRNF